MRKILLIALFALVSIVPHAFAQEGEAQPAAQTQILLNGAGLFTTPQQGSLGPDLWQGIPQDELAASITKINPAITSPGLYDLTLRVLLTETSAPAQENTDFILLRMNKLNQMGAFDSVADLYEKISNQKLTPDILQESIVALMRSNRSAVACLEAKIHPEASGAQSPFFAELTQLCNGLIGKTDSGPSVLIKNIFSDASYKFKPTSWLDLNNISLLERAALIAKNRIDYTALLSATLPLENPALMVEIFKDPALPPALQVQIGAVLTSWGRVPPAQFAEKLKEIGKNFILSDKAASAPWQNLAINYVLLSPPRAQNGEKPIESPVGDAYIALLNQTLLLKKIFGSGAIMPLLPILETYETPEALNDEGFKIGLSVLLNAQSKTAPNWLQKLPEKTNKNKEKSNGYIPILMSAYALGAPLPAEKLPLKLSDEGLQSHPDDYALIALAAQYGEGDLPFSDDINKKYVKENLLTGLKNYVMHKGVDDDSYAKTLESKHLGKVSLAVILALPQQPMGEISPKKLETVLGGLNTVGLSDVARRILIEILLEREFIETGASHKSLETETKENQNHGTSRPPTTR